MVKLLKYEFRGMRSYFFIFTVVVLLVPITDILIWKGDNIIQTITTVPIFLIFTVVAVTAFNSEVVKGREQLVYQTPNSIYKILGAKLLNNFIILLIISLLINIINMITGYVPFIGSAPFGIAAYPEEQKNIIRLFAVFWNSTSITALIILFNFVIAVGTSLFRGRWFEGAAKVIIGIIILYGFVAFMVMTAKLLPANLVLHNGVSLYFKDILNSSGYTGEMQISAFSMNAFNFAATVIYRDESKIVLNLSAIIANILFAGIVYPITAWILKRRVFA